MQPMIMILTAENSTIQDFKFHCSFFFNVVSKKENVCIIIGFQ